VKRAGLDARTAVTLAATLLLWGSAVVGIRSTLHVYPPGPLALMRFFTAGVCLGLYAIPRGLRPPARRDLPAMAATGIFGVTAYHLTLNYGLVSVHAGAASIIVNTAPVWTVLLATLFLGERMPPQGWAGMIVSLAGAMLIALEQGHGLHLSPAAGLLLLAALAWSVNMVLQKPLLAKYSPLEVTTWSLWIGTIPLLIFAPSLLTSLKSAPPPATATLVYLGVVPIAAVYVMWAYVMSRLTASRAAGFLYLIPVVATLVGWAWLREAPGPLGIAGGALVIAGVWIINHRPVHSRHEATMKDEG
jgi:drug/metabolite transporter (DMT)-like permease